MEGNYRLPEVKISKAAIKLLFKLMGSVSQTFLPANLIEIRLMRKLKHVLIVDH